MKYFIDTEFAERPGTIDLISIGIVAEDGRELYCVSSEFDESQANEWVKENVLPYVDKSLAMDRSEIAREVLEFVGDDRPEFWGYYADYDWVVFCWLFGAMIDLPKSFPMYCRDIKQYCDDLGNPPLPKQQKGEHIAIEDARWNMEAYEFLESIRRAADREGS